MFEYIQPLEAAWMLVDVLGPIIWVTKAIAAMIVGIGLVLLPQPFQRSNENPHGITRFEWLLVMISRAGVLIGAFLLLGSVVTPINAFGPLGDFVAWPSLAVNVCCLLWCRRQVLWEHWKVPSPELVVLRSLIAGRPSSKP